MFSEMVQSFPAEEVIEFIEIDFYVGNDVVPISGTLHILIFCKTDEQYEHLFVLFFLALDIF